MPTSVASNRRNGISAITTTNTSNPTGAAGAVPVPGRDLRADGAARFPQALHICTYDVRGTFPDDGTTKPARQTGLVAHTHQLLAELARRHPGLHLALTQTGGTHASGTQNGGTEDPAARPRLLVTPEHYTAELRTIATALPQFLAGSGGAGKDPAKVQHFYEDTVTDPANPLWLALAGQYAAAVAAAGVRDLLLQNINPLVSVLKAEELGLLDLSGVGITGVIHDIAGLRQRLGYVASRLPVTRASLGLIAVSGAVRDSLHRAGLAFPLVRTIPNGMDVTDFQARLEAARRDATFDTIAARNRLPRNRTTIVLSARRVPWKGHLDVVEAAAELARRAVLDDVTILFNGAGLTDTRWPDYENQLRTRIRDLDLTGHVILLDDLTQQEVAACYLGADIAVLPSRDPEPFGYANLEAMIAGVPVIATAHGGPTEYIQPGVSGLLVPPTQPRALADALHALLSDERLRQRLGAGGQATARRYTVAAMVDDYAKAITDRIPSTSTSRTSSGTITPEGN